MAAELVTTLPAADAVLAAHAGALGRDAAGYRHHVYRVANFCLALAPADPNARETIALAAVFHDLGIWTAGTFDYLAPSMALAADYLQQRGDGNRVAVVTAMIREHHKITVYRGAGASLVDAFRRADWADVTWGLAAAGLPRPFVTRVQTTWPDAGFHRRLLTLALGRAARHPLNPLPMMRL